jgi:hypothetical protein
MPLLARAMSLVCLALVCTPRLALGQADPGSNTAAPLPDAPSETPREQTSTSITVVSDSSPVAKAIIRAEGEREVKIEETQRIAAVVPAFNNVISGEGVPLDNIQKTELAWRTTIDPFNLVGAFVLGGLSEIDGSHRGFGWGPGGYAKRVSANYADVVDGTMLAGAVYPILLHQDPRYFRKGAGSIRSRVGHAMLAPFICRGDNLRSQPNFSNLLGNFTAGAISNAYYPAGDRGASLTLINSSIVTLEGSLGNMAMEFSPDVAAWWQRRKGKAHAASPSRR